MGGGVGVLGAGGRSSLEGVGGDPEVGSSELGVAEIGPRFDEARVEGGGRSEVSDSVFGSPLLGEPEPLLMLRDSLGIPGLGHRFIDGTNDGEDG